MYYAKSHFRSEKKQSRFERSIALFFIVAILFTLAVKANVELKNSTEVIREVQMLTK